VGAQKLCGLWGPYHSVGGPYTQSPSGVRSGGQRPLRYWKKKDGLIICNSIPTIWCKDCENRSSGSRDTSAPSEQVWYDTKLVSMATSLEESEKLDLIKKLHANTFHLVKKIVKIGPIDTEIALLIVKK